MEINMVEIISGYASGEHNNILYVSCAHNLKKYIGGTMTIFDDCVFEILDFGGGIVKLLPLTESAFEYASKHHERKHLVQVKSLFINDSLLERRLVEECETHAEFELRKLKNINDANMVKFFNCLPVGTIVIAFDGNN